MRLNKLCLIVPALFLIVLTTNSCRKRLVSDQDGSPGLDSTAIIRYVQANGFVGDGKTDNTKLIQAAIDSTSNAGGGMVVFGKGTFLTGPIELKSNVTLEIKSGATLLATTDEKAYYPAGADTNGPLPDDLQPLITSHHATNIRISGGGTIDGSGRPWWTLYENAKANGKEVARPRLIKLNDSRNIVIDSVKLENSPQFHVSLENCWYVKIEYVTITSPPDSPNTDGIDPATCHFVTISHCTIDTGDDNIAIKSGRYDPSDPHAGTTNIHISDCTFLHGHGMSMGSETGGGIDSVYVDNCTFNGTRNGFRIKSYRGNGGEIRGVVYSNNTMQNVENPILFTGYYPDIPDQSDPPQPVTSKTPYYHDIKIINLKSTNSPGAGLIVGLPEKPMKNIILKNVDITAASGLKIRNATVDTSNVTINAGENGSGNVTASSEAVVGLTPNYEVPDEGTTREIQKLKPDASTSGSSGTNSWPDESDRNKDRYVEFSFGPKNGYDLTVDSLSMLIGNKGIKGMNASVYYSTNPAFSDPKKLTEISPLYENGVIDTTFTGGGRTGLNISVNNGQTLYIRVYPWLPDGTTSTSKYLYIGNVIVSGVTHSPLAIESPFFRTASRVAESSSASASVVWPLTGSSMQSPSFSGGFILEKGAVLESI